MALTQIPGFECRQAKSWNPEFLKQSEVFKMPCVANKYSSTVQSVVLSNNGSVAPLPDILSLAHGWTLCH